jgi:hypothetical protein
MPSSGMWRRIDLVWHDVSEERIAPIFGVFPKISESLIILVLLRILRIIFQKKHRIFKDFQEILRIL